MSIFQQNYLHNLLTNNLHYEQDEIYGTLHECSYDF